MKPKKRPVGRPRSSVLKRVSFALHPDDIDIGAVRFALVKAAG